MPRWSVAEIPPQAGRLAVVTGGAGGLGFETALALAEAGATVILAGRDAARGARAVAAIVARREGAPVSFAALDLASLASVADFAARVAAGHGALHLLVNNAGVMSLPARRVTEDGFEMQLATNYLGHFALTGRLLPLLAAAPGARVVSLSSVMHRVGRIDFADLQAARRYRPWPVYAQSKLAMLLFARELQRRSVAGGWGVTSLAAHPGWARTDLFANGPRAAGGTDAITAVSAVAAPLFSHSAAAGALPTLFAATAPDAVGGGYYGPDGWFELTGDVAPARITKRGRDAAVAARLWATSEALTGVAFAAPPGRG